MPWQPARNIPEVLRCRDCGLRYQQGGGLCRQCQREAARIADTSALGKLAAAQTAALEQLAAIPPAGRLRAEYFDRGVWFVVVWDGTDCGAAALGIPPAHLRGDPSYGRQRG